MKNTACTLSSRQCAFSSEEGTCLHEYATYSCETEDEWQANDLRR
ncbi:conjugal transfer protein TraN [Klebsiella pneumoniae]|nr:conjugal transfer protein TraN [Klebsiella pneumoniae]MBD3700320.1 conjugal transfer protein TraN [Klebsiella pneumoniae]MBD3715625.1 conjugal transfer protein TraN [Klebsiella pneumoniae]MBD3721813.1 conjugal transfer protein TraN [Klebsiella pneumoniae]